MLFGSFLEISIFAIIILCHLTKVLRACLIRYKERKKGIGIICLGLSHFKKVFPLLNVMLAIVSKYKC